ncbi:type II toxin-antitoxin system VapC family toxin [Natronococcus occultus]|uniref:Putative nucleic acid-binding protein, contains PIN domain n=1 Tax=Natronococcus occultus SP4 TaxID=694430 RepID=L0JZ76_9EURY|nr:type II toxin-antitoxin system VapC family toxin [Natronococcus occultus]AGB37394.1 putative nucleic acid-binding protein, contains PIN domain [Natronococcus occultus SP4]
MSDSYLFDASSLVDIVLGTGGVDVDIDVLFDEHILDLTKYEAGNAVWKNGITHDNLSDDEIADAVELIDDLKYELEIEEAPGNGLEWTMRVAERNGLTFYDASYLAAAELNDLKLITEDGPLEDAAKEQDIPVGSISDLK